MTLTLNEINGVNHIKDFFVESQTRWLPYFFSLNELSFIRFQQFITIYNWMEQQTMWMFHSLPWNNMCIKRFQTAQFDREIIRICEHFQFQKLVMFLWFYLNVPFMILNIQYLLLICLVAVQSSFYIAVIKFEIWAIYRIAKTNDTIYFISELSWRCGDDKSRILALCWCKFIFSVSVAVVAMAFYC